MKDREAVGIRIRFSKVEENVAAAARSDAGDRPFHTDPLAHMLFGLIPRVEGRTDQTRWGGNAVKIGQNRVVAIRSWCRSEGKNRCSQKDGVNHEQAIAI